MPDRRCARSCLLALTALALAGCADHQRAPNEARSSLPSGVGSPTASTPSEADFVAYPTCSLYLSGADTRLRIRARGARAVCRRLALQLSAPGSHWSGRPRPPRRILSPICRLAAPDAHLEIDVTDDATGSRRGPQICASLARAGWFDLSPPS
jgi:hypothetical protein